MFLLLDLKPALLTANGDTEFYPWVLPFPEAMMWISNHTRRILGNVSLRMLPLTIVEFDSPLELSPLSLHNPLGWPRSGKTISSSNRLGDPERVM